MGFRRALFAVHMWIGLVLGILLAALGLSGSLLVYDDAVARLLSPPPHATTQGQAMPLSLIAGIAREAAAAQGLDGGQVQIMVPQKPIEAFSVRVGRISPMGNMLGMKAGQKGAADGLQVFIDPASGDVLGTRKALLPPILIFAHQLHGNFLLGREGRSLVVGWLGEAMLLLGVTGLVLWWPRLHHWKEGQWRYAFIVRRGARGLRLQRELHAATGIWVFFVFMVVSFSGLVLAWPQTMGADPPGVDSRAVPAVTVGDQPIGATEAVAAATAAVPGLQLRSVTLPARPDQAIGVNYLSHGAIAATAFVDPYSGRVIAVRDPSRRYQAWMRPVHQGSLNSIWKFLVFLSGLAPTLFLVTGVMMWWKKRRRHMPMTALVEEAPETRP